MAALAELTGKDHKHVLTDIRNMLAELGVMSAEFSADIKIPMPRGGFRTEPCFKLPKRETLILVSGYSVALRAKIVDRWQSLENRLVVTPATGATAGGHGRKLALLEATGATAGGHGRYCL